MKRATDILVGIVVTFAGSYALAIDHPFDPAALIYVGLAYAAAIAVTVVVVVAGSWVVEQLIRARGRRYGR